MRLKTSFAVFIFINLTKLFRNDVVAKPFYGTRNVTLDEEVIHPMIIINAVGDDIFSCTQAISNALTVLSHRVFNGTSSILWTYEDAFRNLSEALKFQIKSMRNVRTRFYSNNSLQDYNIGRERKEKEFISPILESLLSDRFHKDAVAILIVVSQDVRFIPLKDISSMYHHVGKGIKSHSSSDSLEYSMIKLLSKTRRMTSVSDWHDLMVAVLLIGDPAVKEWLLRVRNIYYRHAAGRLAATLFDPRPALLEATLQLRETVRVGYFRSGEICVRKSGSASSRCKDWALMELHCLNVEAVSSSSCLTTTAPLGWRQTVSRTWDSLAFKFVVEEHMWNQSLHGAAEEGALRMLLGAAARKPAPFCWEAWSVKKNICIQLLLRCESPIFIMLGILREIGYRCLEYITLRRHHHYFSCPRRFSSRSLTYSCSPEVVQSET